MRLVWANSAEGVAVIATLVGLLCNMFVKGVMKSIGFIFKNSLKAWPDMNQTLAVLMPSTMHLMFNTMALIVPVLGRRIGFASTAVLGALTIVAALITASFIHTATLLFLPLGILLGLGCALNFHSGVKLVNQLTSKNNGFANGLSQAGSTLGAIAVSFAVAGYFSSLDFKTSLLALGSSLTVLVPVAGCFYWPSRYLSCAEETSKKCSQEAVTNQSIYRSYKYYCFILSQTLNALGFLNFTTYLAAHLHQANGWTDMEAASAYAVNQSVDFFARLLVPTLSDRLPWLRPWIYCVGVVGTGVTMALLAFAEDTVSVYAVCASSGIFSACFIGIWNSLVKDEVGPDHFFTVYSHSLATCGVVQFGLTVLVVFFVQGTSSAGNEYGSLLVIFGSIMATAALPIFVIMIGNAYFPTAQEKDVESPMEEKPRKVESDAASVDLSSASTFTSTLSLDSRP